MKDAEKPSKHMRKTSTTSADDDYSAWIPQLISEPDPESAYSYHMFDNEQPTQPEVIPISWWPTDAELGAWGGNEEDEQTAAPRETPVSQHPAEVSTETWATDETGPQETQVSRQPDDASPEERSAVEEDKQVEASEEMRASWKLTDTGILFAGPIDDAEQTAAHEETPVSQQPVEASPEAWETVEPTPEETPAGWHFADARHEAWSADEEDGLSYAVEEIPVSWELADTAILSAGPIEDAEPDWTYESPDETLPMARRQKETDLATAPASPAESFSEILPSPDRSEGLAPVIPQERTPKPRLPKGRFVVLGIVAALLIGIGAGISMHQANLAKAYDQANEYYESGMFSAAAEAFAELGDYEDAAELCVKAQKWIEAEAMQDAAGKDPDAWDAAAAAYDAVTEPGAADKAQHCRNMATYYRASQKLAEEPMSLNTVKEALELFQNCGNVLDAEMKIKHCENLKSYYRGVWKLEHHPNRPAYLRQALKLLKNCGGVLDADEQIKKCENSLAYLSARKLMSNQEWAKAADAFDDLAKAGFRDSANRQAECQTRADYEEAESAFNEGRYYEAYTKFLAIGDTGYEGLPNMRERAQACIQDMPAGGVMYHNDAYTDSCQLTIDNTSNPNAYYKLYIGEELVIEAFVREDSKLTFSLPAGTYSMKKGYGDTWFGKEDLFGDEGRYYHCTFGGSEAFVLEANYAYIISAGTDGTGIGTQSTNRDDM